MADAIPMIARDFMSHVTKSELLKKITYALVRPELHTENLTRFLPDDDIFEIGPNLGKFNQHPLCRYSDVNARPPSAKSVEMAAMNSIEYKSRALGAGTGNT